MKITIEIKSSEEVSPATMLIELAEMINESQPHEMNRKYIQWSGDTVDIIISQQD